MVKHVGHFKDVVTIQQRTVGVDVVSRTTVETWDNLSADAVDRFCHVQRTGGAEGLRAGGVTQMTSDTYEVTLVHDPAIAADMRLLWQQPGQGGIAAPVLCVLHIVTADHVSRREHHLSVLTCVRGADVPFTAAPAAAGDGQIDEGLPLEQVSP